MTPTSAAARRVGALYFLMSIVAVVREFLFPAFVVAGDATATARAIAAAEPTYRLGLLISLVSLVIFLFVVAGLYQLLKDVDRSQAFLMVLLVTAGIAVSLVDLLNEYAPLMLLSGADGLSAFTKPQLDALALGFLRVHGAGGIIATVFWGLWLFPFGTLVIKSHYFPRILGVLLMVAGFAYVVTSTVAIMLPAYRQAIAPFMMPLYFGEVPIILWLLIKGAKLPPQPLHA